MILLKRVIGILVILAIVVLVFVFTSANKGEISVDLLFADVPTTKTVAFMVAFAAGWVFGLLCTGWWALKLIRERRVLKRALRASESEVTSLRNLPLTDAD